jgi:ABC-type multidrug transport system ATPase subunit
MVIRIGRAADNDVVLDYPMVSAHHARLVVRGSKVRLEDLDSSNGTSVGQPDHKVQQANLNRDDILFLGSLRLPVARLLRKQRAVGQGPQATFAFQAQSIVFGRHPGCDEVLDDPTISSRHARLYHAGGTVVLEDLNSSNGTFVNGKQVRKPVVLKPGDVIGLGSYTFTLNARGELEKRDFRGNVILEARDVGVAVPGKKLIEGISLTIFPSEFVGLMGPSGAGKTTLMNALNGYTPPTGGVVLINGDDLYAQFDQYRTSLGYVPQDDILHPQLTVGAALYYSARLRLPTDYKSADIRERIRKVLEQLEMKGTEKVLIGSAEKKGISGGQRKRVNLAMELLTDPLVLFLDEPTSGLSSEDALMVMKLLRDLANTGKTILMTIHQPSLEVYRLLDNLVLVGRDAGSPEPGRLVYYGPAYPDAVHFFNPNGLPDLKPGQEPSPDEVLRGLKKAATPEWTSRYAKSKYRKDYIIDRASRQPPVPPQAPEPRWSALQGFFQWRTLLARALSIKLSDQLNTAILLVQAPVIALLLVLVFGKQVSEEVTDTNWPDVAKGLGTTLFLLTLAALWFGSSNAVREIVGEWAIYRRERMVNLKLFPYVASKFALLGGLCVIQCAILLGIVGWGCKLEGPWLNLFGMLLLVSLIGVGVGLTLSALAKTSEVAIALLPIVLLTMVVLGGALQPLPDMLKATRLACTAIPTRWAFEGMLLLETPHRPTWAPPVPPALPGQPAPKVDAQKRDMAERYFPEKDYRTSVRSCVIALGVMFVALGAGIMGILRLRDIH